MTKKMTFFRPYQPKIIEKSDNLFYHDLFIQNEVNCFHHSFLRRHRWMLSRQLFFLALCPMATASLG